MLEARGLKIYIDLQLFAEDGPGGEKTETATSKKREDARKKGTVLKSAELNTALILFVSFFSIKIFSGFIYERMTAFTKLLFNEYMDPALNLDIRTMYRLFLDAGIAFLISAGPVVGLICLTAFVANVVQVGFQFSNEALMPQLNKINPISGFKRMFSLKNVFNLVKSILKVIAVGYIAYLYVWDRLDDLMTLMGADITTVISAGINMIFELAFRICVAMMILGIIDYVWQWYQYEKQLKMTKYEVKEEFKQMEGDPKVKSKIKEKQRQISMQRMMSNVPDADVVITNPTHFAVAVRYDLSIADAPVVLAKGQDYIALRIKKIADENGIQIVENKPLARALYDSVDVGAKIPIELYHAVAEVLAFVYGLKNKKAI